MRRGQDPRWPTAHVNLKRLYEERVPAGMTQEEFGAKYEIGSQAMVWQLLNGYVPLSYEQAFKFANGLRCTIHDISPEMDAWCKGWMLPALGVKLRKRAAAVLLALSLLPAAPDAISHNEDSRGIFFAKSLAQIYILRLLRRVFSMSKLSVSEHFAVVKARLGELFAARGGNAAPCRVHP